ncbi:hypothetical protein MSG28_014259 [Choristoneura fumiferana]|uniref:Uncharacterized protein n=1 Tax=Choristoneura fumiferana TaxID=7141 RepID=A0ACC0JGN6_CHOFU|nr:hypothetical protein MSG28_014259 [Choristoneura fumiferana]
MFAKPGDAVFVLGDCGQCLARCLVFVANTKHVEERIGQQIRDGIISARPALDVIRDAQKIYNGDDDDDDDDK